MRLNNRVKLFTVITLGLVMLILIGVLIIALRSDGFGFFNPPDVSISGSKDNVYEYTYDVTKVNGVIVEWVDGDVEIAIREDINEIKITEYSNKKLEEKDMLELSRDDGALKIKWNSEFFSVSTFLNYSKDVLIELPGSFANGMDQLKLSGTSAEIKAENLYAEKVDINSTSGELEINNITGESIKLNTTSGKIDADNIKAVSVEVFSVSGKIELENIVADELNSGNTSGGVDADGNFKELSISTVSGKIEIEAEVCPQMANIDSTSADILMKIPENEGFEVQFDSVSGDIDSEFEKTGTSTKFRYGNGAARFKFGTVSGDVKIEKK